jgi:hypothetical protein
MGTAVYFYVYIQYTIRYIHYWFCYTRCTCLHPYRVYRRHHFGDLYYSCPNDRADVSSNNSTYIRADVVANVRPYNRADVSANNRANVSANVRPYKRAYVYTYTNVCPFNRADVRPYKCANVYTYTHVSAHVCAYKRAYGCAYNGTNRCAYYSANVSTNRETH